MIFERPKDFNAALGEDTPYGKCVVISVYDMLGENEELEEKLGKCNIAYTKIRQLMRESCAVIDDDGGLFDDIEDIVDDMLKDV